MVDDDEDDQDIDWDEGAVCEEHVASDADNNDDSNRVQLGGFIIIVLGHVQKKYFCFYYKIRILYCFILCCFLIF